MLFVIGGGGSDNQLATNLVVRYSW